MASRIQELRTFIEEAYAELQKVTWPDWDQLKDATLKTIIFVFLVAGVIWMMDWVIRSALRLIMGAFGA
jgi:preprotein translocase SecE subunit